MLGGLGEAVGYNLVKGLHLPFIASSIYILPLTQYSLHFDFPAILELHVFGRQDGRESEFTKADVS